MTTELIRSSVVLGFYKVVSGLGEVPLLPSRRQQDDDIPMVPLSSLMEKASVMSERSRSFSLGKLDVCRSRVGS